MSIYLWSLLAFLSTVAGSFLLAVNREWSKSNIWRILAFGSGILLSVSFIHIFPEAETLAPHYAGMGVLLAFLLIFAIEGFTIMHSCMEFADECSIHMVSWTAFGALALHSLIDGLAIAVAFQQNLALGHVVSSAILVHKFTDGLALSGTLIAAQFSQKKSLLIVSALAMATPVGAFLFMPITNMISPRFLGILLGFVSGSFLYIGASDILPRLHKVRDIYCLVWFAIGLVFGGMRWAF